MFLKDARAALDFSDGSPKNLSLYVRGLMDHFGKPLDYKFKIVLASVLQCTHSPFMNLE